MKRIVGWAVFVAALVGLGALIHAGAGPTVRWTSRIDRRYPNLAVKLVGNHVLTMPFGHGDPGGPLQVRDVTTGEVVLSAWEDGEETNAFKFSPDGGHAGGVVRVRAAPALRWVDLSTGQQREAPLGQGDCVGVFFSPDSQLVFAEDSDLLIWPARVRVSDSSRRILRAFARETGTALATIERWKSGSSGFAGGKLLLTRNDRSGIAVWDPATGQSVTLPTPRDQFVLSPDGWRIFVETAAGYDLWSLDGVPKRMTSIPVGHFSTARFSSDGRIVVVAGAVDPGSYAVRLFDAARGEKRWEHSFPAPIRTPALEVSPDGRWVAIQFGRELAVLDVHQKRLAWSMPERVSAMFSRDSAALIITSVDDHAVRVVDTETGREQAAIPMPIRLHYHSPFWAAPVSNRLNYDPRFHSTGRQLWLSDQGRDGEPPETWLTRALTWLRPPVPEQKAGLLLGLEWPSRRELLRLTDRGVQEHHVADDGSFVLTLHDEGNQHVLRRWDLPQPKPWGWIVGVPLALGAALVALRAWWKASRPRQNAEEAQP